MTQFHIYDIQKKADGIVFEETLDLQEELLERNQEILAVSPVAVAGRVRFEANLYFLEYQVSYDITMASSRSMQPVTWHEHYPVMEIFVESEELLKEKDLVDADLALIIEDELIILDESVADNILLQLPSKVLTPEEEAGEELPSGDNWTVMTEADFELENQKKKESASPFAQLQGLFDEE